MTKTCSCIKVRPRAPLSTMPLAVAISTNAYASSTSRDPQSASGKTGKITRLNVEFVTPANDAYHAAAAVATPNQPPTFVHVSDAWNEPIVSHTKVRVRSRNTNATAPLTRNDAMNMYAVKIVQPMKKVPNTVSVPGSPGTMLPTWTMKKTAIQNPPNEENA